MALTVDVPRAQTSALTVNPPNKPSAKSAQRRPNYGSIHSKPLPVEVYPLPAFIPHNPLSALRIAYALFSQFVFPPSSRPGAFYEATFSQETRSVVVTDPKAVRALWEAGFFGKGSLSRSEPTWLAQERKRRGLDGGLTSEMFTQQRRRERMEMKNERARLQRQAVEEQLKAEQSVQKTENVRNQSTGPESTIRQSVDGMLPNYSSAWDPTAKTANPDERIFTSLEPKPAEVKNDLPIERTPIPPQDDAEAQLVSQEEAEPEIKDEEHLQLSLEEAFFLVYALGVLRVNFATRQNVTEAGKLLELVRQHSYSPPRLSDALRPDDPFLVNYVVYHHFRALGWVIRPGNKFAVDFLLYKGGPVFSHAEFAIVIVPSYVDDWWFGTDEQQAEVERKRKEQQWWWVQNMNRVQTQVLKTLVLVYVAIPPPDRIEGPVERGDVGGVLKHYTIREFVIKRWTPNRQRE